MKTDRASRAARRAALVFTSCALTVACGDTPSVAPDASATADGGASITASCTYTNPFSMTEECREYADSSWTAALVTDDCAGARGTLRLGSACAYPAALGQCLINGGRPDATRITFPGGDAGQCAATARGCTVFARGAFTPLGVCVGDGGTVTPPSDASVASNVFVPPVRECRDPLPGQRPGAGPNGQVCTWAAVSAATEEGRRYDDYASCDRVRNQRPYYPVDAAPPRATPDPRLQDPAYVAELNWVRSQVEASACVCCHSTRVAPSGPSNWYLEAPGNWMDSFHPSGLALGAGWVDSRALGAYPATQNNGFARTTSGVPSTDPARMARFFEAELANRGRTRASFDGATPFGGPIYSQLVYTPSACTGTDGVGADGTVRWTGGGARYLYVLEAGSANPGVPPNLDLPEGTRWRVDVPPTGSPIASGVRYGSTPAGASQRFPETGAPRALSAGSMYYLYVLADVGIPITRCTFTAR